MKLLLISLVMYYEYSIIGVIKLGDVSVMNMIRDFLTSKLFCMLYNFYIQLCYHQIHVYILKYYLFIYYYYYMCSSLKLELFH